ncbi:MAG: hypothetical protein NTW48_09940 [Chloroflexi bacterium]|nr:hypothetical protein [Chloroflexota bacterium]
MADHHQQQRRAADSPRDKIGELIEQENDPKNRALLVVLQNINLSLIANTQTVNDIDEELKLIRSAFETHTIAEAAMINKGKGMWRILGGSLGICQLVVLWIVAQAYSELQGLHKYDSILETRVTVLEQKK